MYSSLATVRRTSIGKVHIWLSRLLALSILEESYSRNAPYELNLRSMFLLLQSPKIWKPTNFEIFGSKKKGLEKGTQNRVRSYFALQDLALSVNAEDYSISLVSIFCYHKLCQKIGKPSHLKTFRSKTKWLKTN